MGEFLPALVTVVLAYLAAGALGLICAIAAVFLFDAMRWAVSR